jgi:NADH-quinone oxidoreductase subunit N
MTERLLQTLEANLVRDTTAFAPELLLCLGIVILLLARLVPFFDRNHLGWVALVIALGALGTSWMQWAGFYDYDPRVAINANLLESDKIMSLDLFSGMLVFDNFSIFIKLFLYGFATLVVFLSLLTGIPDREDSADFHVLLLGATLGMSIMASANHLLMIFIGIEMASVPSYALSGFLKGRRPSSEAALKYVVYGGGAAGVMLYGMSLLAGTYGTGYLPDVVRFVAAGEMNNTILLGVLFVLVGIAFKLAAVPFHFWCPDVFEGAPAEVGAFLSVASKGAALALLGRITLGLSGFSVTAFDPDAWQRAAPYLVPTLSIFAVVTTTFGNLAAYAQTNLKRLLAYSTIAHAGFMMMGLATLTRDGAGAVLFYLVVYLFMNLGAFAVVAFLRNMTGSEDLADFRGLASRSPVLVVTLGVFLFSLLGIPPLAGFAAKFQIFSVLFEAADQYMTAGKPMLAYTLYGVVLAAGLNTVLSLFYYVKVLKVMALERNLEEVEGTPVRELPLPMIHSVFLSALAISLLGIFVQWGPLLRASTDTGVTSFAPVPRQRVAAAQAGVPVGGPVGVPVGGPAGGPAGPEAKGALE